MNTTDYIDLFRTGLNKVKEELQAYTHEDELWIVEKQIKNSAGNLAQHLIGNLKTFVGKFMGGIPYIREREREFGERQFDRETLIRLIEETSGIMDTALSGKEADFLQQAFPAEAVLIKEGQTNDFMLTYLYAHLNYHLGQINYHRRLLQS